MKEIIYKNKTSLILFLILSLGLYLRLDNLTYYSFWYDELFSMDFSNPNRSFAEMIKITVEDVHPPFYQFLLWIWLKLFGFTEFSARLLSVILGIITILSSYFFAKEFYDKKTSLTIAFIFCINFFLIWYSQEARSYQLTVLLSILSYLFLYKSLVYTNKKNIYIYWIVTILWMYTHYFSFFIIISQFLFTLFYIYCFADDRKRLIKIVFLTATILFLSLLPLFPYILEVSTSDKFYFLEKPEALFFLTYMNIYFGNGSIYFLLFSFLLNIYFISMYKLTKKEKTFLSMSLFWIVFGYLLLYLKSVYSFSLIQLRYTIVIIPPIVILSIFGISKLNKYFKIIILLVFTIFSYKIQFIDTHPTYKQNIRDTLKYVSQYKNVPIYELELGDGINNKNIHNTNHFQVYSNILNLKLKAIDNTIFKKQYLENTLPDCFWLVYMFDTVQINSLEDIFNYYEINLNNSLSIEYKKKYYKAEAALISNTKKERQCLTQIKTKD